MFTIPYDEQSIVALSTPMGAGALALIRLSGADVLSLSSSLVQLQSKEALTDLKTHTIHYASIINKKQDVIDTVMISIMKAPRTFTGEDTLEISCHNNPFIIEEIIQQALENGIRLAHEGEFTKRAVLNNKIDLLQAESINDLIHAHSKYALKQSLQQLSGTLSNWIISIEKKLLKCIAYTESSFEFIDEEMAFDQQINEQLHNIISNIKKARHHHSIQEQIKDGIKISLVGTVNAGKSSLFNSLLNKSRAIVTDIPGTTRDTIEAGVYRNGFYCTFIDTAGLRDTKDSIEKEGISRSYDQAKQADIILLVIDGSKELSSVEQNDYQKQLDKYANKTIIVKTKSDLPSASNTLNIQSLPIISLSNKTQENISLLNSEIEKKISKISATLDAPFLLNKRQYRLLSILLNKLEQLHEKTKIRIDYELCALHLKDALEELSELSGKTITQQSMDTVFKEFCIGK